MSKRSATLDWACLPAVSKPFVSSPLTAVYRPPLSSDAVPQPSGHLPVLDGIRGLAILMVMVQHFFQRTPKGDTLADDVIFGIANRCWMGVDLFFVLSGFLITGILCQAKGQAHFFRNFYMRRALRIFPAYYAVLAILFLLLPAVSNAGAAYMSDSLGDAPWHWTYLSNLRIAWRGAWYEQHIPNVFWSLAIEEQFYILWPAVVWLCGRRALIRLCAALFVASLCLRWILALDPDVNYVTSFVLTPTRMDGLVLGAILAVLYRSPPRDHPGWRRAIQVTGLLSLVLLAYLTLQRPPGWREMPIQSLRFTAVALVSGTLIWLCVTGPRKTLLKRLFVSTPMCFLGKYSYALYLWHGPSDALARHIYDPRALILGSRIPSQALFFALALGLSIFAALSSWWLLEKHSLKLKKMFA
jgi:peptidoglycan/LPS O-acetylase OafA/YrhL